MINNKISIAVLGLLLGACGGQHSSREQAPEAASPWPKMQSALPADPALESRVADLLARMTLEEKVGQLIQAEIKYATPDDVRTYHLGGILNGGGTYPNNDKFATPDDWLALARAYREASMDTSDGGVGIPVLWGSDAVHGHNNVIGATLFPHNIGLGAAHDPALIKRIGEATAREVAVTGIHWTFAPTVAVAQDDRWGRTFESYAENPALVGDYAGAMVEGIQGEIGSPDFLHGSHVISSTKHFVGDGGTRDGMDRGDTQVSEEELAHVHAAGYYAALEAGVQTIMASFNSWNGDRLHGHKHLLTDVLKERLGFDGFVVGDWNGHRFVPGCTLESCAAAINAGLDMFMVPSDWKALYHNTLAQAQSGEIPLSRLDDAVTRILRVKLRAGLFELQQPLAGKPGILGSAEHRAIAREAVRKSLVLLKNNPYQNRDGLLPLRPNQNILVAGDGADNIGKQSGGWTISWQGTGNTRADFPGATSIFEGIQAAVESAGGEALLSVDGEFNADSFANGSQPDVAIVVFGEEPYAEWHGDITSLEYQFGDKRDLPLLKKLKAQGIPVVSIFLSGRPLWVNPEINASDAFVAAWLPGSEGEGVADVIIADAQGEPRYDFTGKLNFSWPKGVKQTPLNQGDADYNPLFAYGFGLTYSDKVELASNLSEQGESYAEGPLRDAWLMVWRPRAPWDLLLLEAGEASVVAAGNVAETANSNLRLTAVDMLNQEDARRLQWQGPATMVMQARKAQDMSRYLAAGGALSFDVRLDTPPESDVLLSIGCGDDCTAGVSLAAQLRQMPPSEWHAFSVDLQCFAKQGVDFTRIETGFALQSQGPLALAVANVKYLPDAAAQATLRCDD